MLHNSSSDSQTRTYVVLELWSEIDNYESCAGILVVQNVKKALIRQDCRITVWQIADLRYINCNRRKYVSWRFGYEKALSSCFQCEANSGWLKKHSNVPTTTALSRYLFFPWVEQVPKGDLIRQQKLTRGLGEVPIEAIQKCYENWKKRGSIST